MFPPLFQKWLRDHHSGLGQSRMNLGCCQPLLGYGFWHCPCVQAEVWLLLVPAELWQVLALVLVPRTFQKGKVVGESQCSQECLGPGVQVSPPVPWSAYCCSMDVGTEGSWDPTIRENGCWACRKLSGFHSPHHSLECLRPRLLRWGK